LFKAAIKAITQHKDDDAPQEARKRCSGEKEGGGPLLVTRHILRAAGRPAARGRYVKLRTTAPKRAAIPETYVAADLNMADTLDCMNPFWPPEAEFCGNEMIDDQRPARQDYYSPHL